MRILGLAGWSGSGKTTLLTAVVPELVSRGLKVSTVKHAHHEFDIDRPGKDSWRHRLAGASEVMVSSARRWALMHELRDEPEPALDDLVRHMTPVDLLLVEGFKQHPHPKIEVYRPVVGKPLLYPDDPFVVAIATDEPLAAPLPLLPLDDPPAVARFICDHLGLA
ncbi:MAG TPA: molybdopterin-guanine dinucleotide biosynthesis protein B [Stellaceae bacterium]|jgi:molybdopterin-guanine dinucleotide biosynthesis protein B|nr:molybdopterin-guanine dinucleotide biosynthesis protein B [Stellaceae bacterium]